MSNLVRLASSSPTVSHEPIAEPAADESGDPIFAAIAAHRAACVAYHRASWTKSHLNGGHPNLQAAEDRSNAAMHREGEALEDLLKCRPTTFAGVAAMLDHLSEPEFLIKDREGTGMSTLEGRFECRSRAAQKLPGRLAAVIRRIAAGAPAPSPAPTTQPSCCDPIYAAIGRHREAWAVFGERCSELDDLGTPEARAEWDRLQDAVDEGRDGVTRPTTVAGAAAALRYAANPKNDIFGEEPAEFMRAMAAALEKIPADKPPRRRKRKAA
jgi:hypothetical protein